MTSDDSAFSWTEAEKDLMEGIDTTVPHSARIWNYWLGGRDNYSVDRQAGDEFCKIYPGIVDDARAYRQFISRTVRYLAGEAGIRQFLDIGTGLPTAENTHEVAQRVASASRIVYVDNDPLVLAHARALLTSTPDGVTSYIDADLRKPAKILSAASNILDFTNPIALVLSGILGHMVDDVEAYSIVNQLVDGLPPGSYLMLQDSTTLSKANAEALEYYNDSGAVPYNLREPEAITRFFDGLELIEPGVVPIQLWRPEDTTDPLVAVNPFGGVGRKS